MSIEWPAATLDHEVAKNDRIEKKKTTTMQLANHLIKDVSTSRRFWFYEREITANHVMLLVSTAFLLNVAGPNTS